MDGLLIVDKPLGLTSHDVVAQVRRLARTKKVGHAGTLDPLATGVLVLAVGQATRVLEYLVGHDKQYWARVRLGRTTTTYDAEGQVVSETPGPWPTPEQIETALAGLRGEQLQQPPPFSAIKQGGEPLYAKARRGEVVETPARPVIISTLELLAVELPELEIRVRCGKGTYIRSLAHDLGQALGVGAYLTALRREASGPFSLQQAHTLEALTEAAAAGRLAECLLPLETGLAELPVLEIDQPEARALSFGQGIDGPQVADGTVGQARQGDTLIAIVYYDSQMRCWRPRKVLRPLS
jgi:tRNA pseudouridine55 synthase